MIAGRDKGPTKKTMNMYQPGDYVLFDAGPKVIPKMSTRMKGPFKVVQQFKNDVQVRNLVTDAIVDYSLADLSPFFGSKQDAIEAARRDHDQHEVESIVSYHGNHDDRYNLEFMVKFADGEIVELTYTPDLRCDALMAYCAERRYLYHITMDVKLAKRWISNVRKENIKAVPGQSAFIDIRVFGGRWYDSLQIPDYHNTNYVMEFKFTHWERDKKYLSTGVPTPEADYTGQRKRIVGKYLVTDQLDVMDNYKIWCFGDNTAFDPDSMVLLDEEMVRRYPRLRE